MTSSVRRVVAARERGRFATAAILSELRAARLDRNVSGRAVADALGITTGQYSRLERGLTRGLTIEQAVHLALVLPSPNAWSRGLRNKALTKFGQQRFAAILNNMRTSGHITHTQWETALSRGDFGRPIAGAAAMLAAEAGKKPLCPGSPGCPEEGVPEDEELVYPAGTPETVTTPRRS